MQKIPKNTEVAIVGGGLAGLAAALELRALGREVILFEKGSYPRHKVCGEYISNEVRPALECRGLFPHHLQPEEISHFRLSAVSGRSVKVALPLGGFGLSRYALDNFLYQKARERGVQVITSAEVTGVERQGERFLLHVRTGASTQARLVMGAQGKRSRLDRQWQRPFMQKPSGYVGIKAHYAADFTPGEVALHNFPGGYCGLSRVEEGRVNLCLLTTANRLRDAGNNAWAFVEGLGTNPHLGVFLREAVPLFERPLTIAQVSFASRAPVENEMLMLGDAAGLIHPLCGNGMAMALQSGWLAAPLAHEYLAGRLNRQALSRSYQSAWRQNFSGRMAFGGWVQHLMGGSTAAAGAVVLAQHWPGLLRRLIRLSHGKAVA